ncbi:hypothetical protein BpHYR1_029789, partial [Brachionus plicatilis]
LNKFFFLNIYIADLISGFLVILPTFHRKLNESLTESYFYYLNVDLNFNNSTNAFRLRIRKNSYFKNIFPGVFVQLVMIQTLERKFYKSDFFCTGDFFEPKF